MTGPIVPAHIRREILWGEIYQQAVVVLHMDTDSARVYATETLEDILEADEYDWHLAYSGEE